MTRYLIIFILLLNIVFCYAARSPYNGKTITLINDKWQNKDKEINLPIRLRDDVKKIVIRRTFKLPEKTQPGEYDYKLIIDGGVGEITAIMDGVKLLDSKLCDGLPAIFYIDDIIGIEHELEITVIATDIFPKGICGIANVWLEKSPQIHIDEIKYFFHAGDKVIKVWYSISGNKDNLPVVVKVSFASRGTSVYGYSSLLPVKFIDGKSENEQYVNKIKMIEPWDYNNRERCRIKITLLNGTKEIDDVEIFADAYDIKAESNRIKINNNAIAIQGVKLPGGAPVYSGKYSEELSRLKKMGFNVILSDDLPVNSQYADAIAQNNFIVISKIDPNMVSEYMKYSSQLLAIAGWYCVTDDVKGTVDKIRKYDASKFIIIKNENQLLFYPAEGSGNEILLLDLNFSDVDWQMQLSKAELSKKSILVTDISCNTNSEEDALALKSKISKLRSSDNVFGYFVKLPDSPFIDNYGDPAPLYTSLISNNSKLLITADYKASVNQIETIIPNVKVVIECPVKDKVRKTSYTLIRVIDSPDGSNKIDRIENNIFEKNIINDVSNFFSYFTAPIPGEYTIHYALANDKGIISSCSISFVSNAPVKN